MSSNEQIIYIDDFESGVDNAWSNARSISENSNTQNNTYLGGFLNSENTSSAADTEKTVYVPAGADRVTITFDFLEIDDWHGEHFYVYINGQQIDLGSFYIDSIDGNEDALNTGSSGNISWEIGNSTDLSDPNALGNGWSDEKHEVTITIQNPDPALTVGFGASANAATNLGRWAIDNLKIASHTDIPDVPDVPTGPDVTVCSEIFHSDFTSGASGWSRDKTKQTKNGDTFLHGSQDKLTEKVFDVPAGADRLEITFDFLEIDSWDGEYFFAFVNGQRVNLGKFYNEGIYGRGDVANSGTNGNISWTVSDTNDLIQGGVSRKKWSDEKHSVTITVENPGSQLTLGFSSKLDEKKKKESWGIDNLKITSHVDVSSSEVGSVNGRVFNDVGEDGIDSNESGETGVSVALLDTLGNAMLDAQGNAISTVTDANGNYQFDNIPMGDYRLQFIAPSGRVFTTQNAGSSDSLDSDVNALGISDIFTIVAGRDTGEVDAGLVVPNQAPVITVVETTVNEDSTNVIANVSDIDGRAVSDISSATNGSVSINYTTGEITYTPNTDFFGTDQINIAVVDDDGAISTKIFDVVVLGTDEDAPIASNDQATTCYDQAAVVNVLGNDRDPDGDSLTVTSVNGQSLSIGGPAVNIGGVLVSLSPSGSMVFDGSSAYADLVFGQDVTNTYSYTITDGKGNNSTANVQVTFKGETDTLAKVDAQLTNEVLQFQVQNHYLDIGLGVGPDAFDIRLSDAGSLDGVYKYAYCLDIRAPIDGIAHGLDILDASVAGATITIADEAFLSADQKFILELPLNTGFNGASALDNLDLINWIINQDFENTDNGDGLNQNYTGAEVQAAIWALTNNAAPLNGLGTIDNVNEILGEAVINGEGFVASAGDLVGVYVGPQVVGDDGTTAILQPFIVAMDLYEMC